MSGTLTRLGRLGNLGRAHNQPRNQRGIGLLELMLSLAIIAVLIIMATRYYQTARRDEQTNEALRLVNVMAAAAANWRIGHTSYKGITYLEVYNQGLVPRVWGKTGTGAGDWLASGSNSLILSPGSDTDTVIVGIVFDDNELCLAIKGRFHAQVPTGCAKGTNTVSIPFGPGKTP